MRLFVAVSPDEPARAAAASAQAEIRSRTALEARWVPAENLHVTLAFLGSVDPALVPPLRGALAAAVATVDRFSVRLGEVGAFPTPRRPRVLWIGIAAGAERLAALADLVRAALLPFPVAREEKPLRPHLTIARVRSPRPDRALAEHLARPPRVPDAGWEVRSVTLFESVLGAGGACHRPAAVLPLGGI
jgi:2'-5' RNA ligase